MDALIPNGMIPAFGKAGKLQTFSLCLLSKP